MGTIELLVFICIARCILGLPDRDCQEIQNFVSAYTRLLKQIPLKTYPVNNFCISNDTVLDYNSAVEHFQYALGNETCAMDFNQNRLNIVQMLYDHMSSIWNAANCADCVSNQNDTAQFLELYDYQINCTNHHPDPCDICSVSYSEMQHFYEGLLKSRKGVVCFDIEDRMNQTRHAWSAKFQCCKGKQNSKMAFIGFASGISSLPLIFYAVMYFITRRKEALERAAAPLLNDQTVEETEEQPQASTSYSQQEQKQHSNKLKDGQSSDDESKDIQYGVEEEPKINNLNITRSARESQLIDINDDSESRSIQQNLEYKLHPAQADDDVSLLGARSYND